MNRFAFALCLFFVAALSGSAAENILTDSSFEGSSESGFSTSYIAFGNAFREGNTPHTGEFAAKLFGNFSGAMNWSGVSQDVPADPGAIYAVQVMARHNSNDALQGETCAFIKIEFYNDAGEQLATAESKSRLTSDSKADMYQPLKIAGIRAPEGAAKLRVVLLLEQHEDNGSGAAYMDDVELIKAAR
ncbi:MAG: hypothetical protein KJ626_02140 [Verrucomicrobia bacterium]|nr:hypothetical protein [Verrucomicrobiota bacterium]